MRFFVGINALSRLHDLDEVNFWKLSGKARWLRGWLLVKRIKVGSLFLPEGAPWPWLNDFVDELAAFPKGTHDDCVDSLTLALNYVRHEAGGNRRRVAGAPVTCQTSLLGGKSQPTALWQTLFFDFNVGPQKRRESEGTCIGIRSGGRSPSRVNAGWRKISS